MGSMTCKKGKDLYYKENENAPSETGGKVLNKTKYNMSTSPHKLLVDRDCVDSYFCITSPELCLGNARI